MTREHARGHSHNGRLPLTLVFTPGLTIQGSSIVPFAFPRVCLVFMRFSTGPRVSVSIQSTARVTVDRSE